MKRTTRMINNKYYEYINLNPKDKYTGDCVIRAVALILNQSWEQTMREMLEVSVETGYMINCPECEEEYLKVKGFVKCKEPRKIDNTKLSVREFIDWCIADNIIAKVGSHHLTAIKNGKVHDTWDCSKNTMHTYFKKGN